MKKSIPIELVNAAMEGINEQLDRNVSDSKRAQLESNLIVLAQLVRANEMIPAEVVA